MVQLLSIIICSVICLLQLNLINFSIFLLTLRDLGLDSIPPAPNSGIDVYGSGGVAWQHTHEILSLWKQHPRVICEAKGDYSEIC